MNQLPPYPPSVLAPDNYSYKHRPHSAPAIPAGFTLVFDEPGRVLGRIEGKPGSGVCCRSHYFRVSQDEHGTFFHLHVQHGGGEQSWRLDYDKRTIEGLRQMDSDSRFRLLWVIADAHNDSALRAAEKRDAYWRKAAAEKRIKTRKVKGGVKVWVIEPAKVGA